MSANRIAMRYARGLYRLSAGDQSRAQSAYEALAAVAEIFNIEASARVLKSPVMPADLKEALFNAAISKSGASDEIKRFCATVVGAGRVALFPTIVTLFKELLDEASGKVNAKLVSAVELGQKEIADVKAALSQALAKKVEIQPIVDSSLLGGFVVRIGNLVLDYSVKTKLDALAQNAVH